MSIKDKSINSCLTCSAEILIEQNTMAGELIECTGCGQGHEVIEKDGKLGITFAPEIEEDWGE